MHFEVELLSKRESSKGIVNVFADLDTDGNDVVNATEILAFFHARVRNRIRL